MAVTASQVTFSPFQAHIWSLNLFGYLLKERTLILTLAEAKSNQGG